MRSYGGGVGGVGGGVEEEGVKIFVYIRVPSVQINIHPSA